MRIELRSSKNRLIDYYFCWDQNYWRDDMHVYRFRETATEKNNILFPDSHFDYIATTETVSRVIELLKSWEIDGYWSYSEIEEIEQGE